MAQKRKSRWWVGGAVCLAVSMAAAAAGPNPGTPWPATDALGRRLPLAPEVGPPKTNRWVGIFYFEWLVREMPIPKCPAGTGPYDVSRILAQEPLALRKPDSPLWGRVGEYHFWGEPLFGYYRSEDPWVIRRHLLMLADAGVDALILDATNAETYQKVYRTICRVAAEIRAQGGPTPQLVFMLNTQAGATAQTLLRDFYAPGLHSEQWFRWGGKPLLICDPEAASPEVREFFTLRLAHWPFTMTNTVNAWHWEATYPQPFGFTDDPNRPEQVNVSVAQNLSARDGQVANMSSGRARGRSFHDGMQDITADSANFGRNFQEQWRRALALEPPFVMITGWNEWIAGRWGRADENPVFVDQYNEEFSRDIEPMRGGHGDNYYWQLVANVRRYKGVNPIPPASAPQTMSGSRSFKNWELVQPEYRDHRDETLPRDFDGVGGTHYANHSGRNDLISMKVARDQTRVYFYVRTREPISPASGSNWMWLLIDVDQNHATGWEGYDYIVNRQPAGVGKAWLEKCVGGWKWERVAEVDLRMAGNELQITVPRRNLGLRRGTTRTAFDFKWADHLQYPGDLMDFYVSGDVAPEGRFNFRYSGE